MEERLSQKMNNSYTLWYHDVNNDKWDLASYKKLMTLNTYDDLLLCCCITTPDIDRFFFLSLL